MNDLTVIRFAGRCFSSEDVALMCQAARDYASLGITEIARTVCEWLDWKRPNGRLKTMNAGCFWNDCAIKAYYPFPRYIGPARAAPTRSPSTIKAMLSR